MGNNRKLRDFYILWSTQSLSHLGSAMTSFALTLWLFDKTGSALSTAALTICTYAPYVVMSIFAGAISDKFDKKKTMLVCDALAALATGLSAPLSGSDRLSSDHPYYLRAVSSG
jgi:MFS family permease